MDEDAPPGESLKLTETATKVLEGVLAQIPVLGMAAPLIGLHAARMAESLRGCMTAFGGTEAEFFARLADDDALRALVAHLVDVGVKTGMADKRLLLAKAVARAMLGDDAEIDEAIVLARVLERIDQPEIHALVRLIEVEKDARAQQKSLRSPHVEPNRVTEEEADGAVRKALQQAADETPAIVISQLIATGLLLVGRGAILGDEGPEDHPMVYGVAAAAHALIEDLRRSKPLDE